MMGDALRGAVTDANEFRKIGETHDEIVIYVIEPIGAAASQCCVIASRIAVFLELDRRHERLPFEYDQRAIEAIDDPPLHLPCAEEEAQPAKAGRSFHQEAARCAASACRRGSFQPGRTKWHV